jgi:hypothetical protein
MSATHFCRGTTKDVFRMPLLTGQLDQEILIAQRLIDGFLQQWCLAIPSFLHNGDDKKFRDKLKVSSPPPSYHQQPI